MSDDQPESNVMVLPVRTDVEKPKLEVGGKLAGIVPRNIDEIFRLASAISQSGLAPKDMSTPERLTVAIMTGLELGLPPMFAINKIAVINGRPSLWGDAIPGLLWSRGFAVDEILQGQDEDRCAVCTVTRPTGEKITRSFSVRDAKKAGLWGKLSKYGEPGPWIKYPERMLAMRARGFAARDGAADILGGLYLREELEDVPAEPRDITPVAEIMPQNFKRKRIVGKSADGRTTAYKAKNEGMEVTFNEIIGHIRAAADLEFLNSLRDSYAQELADLPTQWMKITSQEFVDKWADLGGEPHECPMLEMEERG